MHIGHHGRQVFSQTHGTEQWVANKQHVGDATTRPIRLVWNFTLKVVQFQFVQVVTRVGPSVHNVGREFEMIQIAVAPNGSWHGPSMICRPRTHGRTTTG
jgi:hypothetical protein